MQKQIKKALISLPLTLKQNHEHQEKNTSG